ncbi:hypothetical protein B7767_23445 [Streptomyces sp. 13-12-16]|nr:hypothetical protein B7767_23445 [Streptomyces sp. 13-12-16]
MNGASSQQPAPVLRRSGPGRPEPHEAPLHTLARLLADAFADRWGVTEDRFPRKTVRAELRLTSPEPGN